jgi:hypothetical protein
MNSARNIEPELRLKAAQLHIEMGDWVHSSAPWQVISHLTFAWEASVWPGARCYEKFMRTELRGVREGGAVGWSRWKRASESSRGWVGALAGWLEQEPIALTG